MLVSSSLCSTPHDSALHFNHCPDEVTLLILGYLTAVRDKVAITGVSRRFRLLGSDFSLWRSLVPASWRVQNPRAAYGAWMTLHHALRQTPPPLPPQAAPAATEEAAEDKELLQPFEAPYDITHPTYRILRRAGAHTLVFVDTTVMIYNQACALRHRLDDVRYCWLCPQSLFCVGFKSLTIVALQTLECHQEVVTVPQDTFIKPFVDPSLLSACELLKLSRRPFTSLWDPQEQKVLPTPPLRYVDQGLCLVGEEHPFKVADLDRFPSLKMAEVACEGVDRVDWFRRVGSDQMAGYFFIEDEMESVDGIRIWELGTGRTLHDLPLQNRLEGMVHLDAERTATIDREGEIAIFNLKTGTRLMHWKAHEEEEEISFCLGYSQGRDSALLLSAASSGVLCVWDPQTGARLRTLPIPKWHSSTMVVMEEQRRIYLSGPDGTVALEFNPDSPYPALIPLADEMT